MLELRVLSEGKLWLAGLDLYLPPKRLALRIRHTQPRIFQIPGQLDPTTRGPRSSYSGCTLETPILHLFHSLSIVPRA